jgi:hypothetical protein
MRKFAEGTTVPIHQSRHEIEKVLSRANATSFAFGQNPTEAVLTFTVQERRLRFGFAIPQLQEFEHTGKRRRALVHVVAVREAEIRRRWRALALVLKAKFESVDSGVASFDDEFLAHFVVDDGRTIGQVLGARLEAITSGRAPLLLGTG